MAAKPHVYATRALQEWLRAQGQLDIRVDGTVGPKTLAAVKEDGGDMSKLLLRSVEELRPKLTLRAATHSDPALEAQVRKQCERFGVAVKPVFAVIGHESNWNPKAKNASGAIGLMQLTRWPIAQWNVDHPEGPTYTRDDRYDVAINIEVGVWYLSFCAKEMGVSPASESPDDWALIYGAFNLGPGAMNLWRAGSYTHESLVDAWSGQSALLKQGGIDRYASNASTLFV